MSREKSVSVQSSIFEDLTDDSNSISQPGSLYFSQNSINSQNSNNSSSSKKLSINELKRPADGPIIGGKCPKLHKVPGLPPFTEFQGGEQNFGEEDNMGKNLKKIREKFTNNHNKNSNPSSKIFESTPGTDSTKVKLSSKNKLFSGLKLQNLTSQPENSKISNHQRLKVQTLYSTLTSENVNESVIGTLVAAGSYYENEKDQMDAVMTEFGYCLGEIVRRI